ncbi:hypothetical protein HDK77DRAFT_487949 [Phyllosticta capitalensis]
MGRKKKKQAGLISTDVQVKVPAPDSSPDPVPFTLEQNEFPSLQEANDRTSPLVNSVSSSSGSNSSGKSSPTSTETIDLPFPTSSDEIPQSRLYHTLNWTSAVKDSHRLVAFDDERFIPKQHSDTKDIQEIGLCIFDPELMPNSLKTDFTNPAWLPTAISLLRTRHVRIEETLHLLNDNSIPPKFHVCPGGCQNHSLYCTTEILKKKEIASVMAEHLNVQCEQFKSKGNYRPTALLMQGCGDVTTLRDLDVELNTNHIRLLDLQQINLPRRAHDGSIYPLSLRYAVEQMGISYKHAHNSANDATWTLVSGLVTAIQGITQHEIGKKLDLNSKFVDGVFIPSIPTALTTMHLANQDKLLFSTSSPKEESSGHVKCNGKARPKQKFKRLNLKEILSNP